MAGNLTSAVTNIEFLDNIGVQFNFTGTPTGTFQVQVSADYSQDQQGNVLNAGNWIGLLSVLPTASGSADSAYVDLNQLSAPWIRAIYTRTSGTGTLNAYIVAKQV
jgi:hypothetical protein